MSIQSEITRITGAVADAYTAASDMGATMPTEQTVANLPAAIRSIPQSGGGSTGDVVTYQRKYFDSSAKSDVTDHIEMALWEGSTFDSFLGYMDSLLPQLIMCTSNPVVYSKRSDETKGQEIASRMSTLSEDKKYRIMNYLAEMFSIIGDRSDLDNLSETEKTKIYNLWKSVFSSLGLATYSSSLEFVLTSSGVEYLHIVTLQS